MDSNLMKFLEEDEDENMHSGADVDAFTAELKTDIEGNASASQQPPNSGGVALSHGSSQNRSQFLTQWQTSAHDGIVNFQSGQDPMATEGKEQHSSKLELHSDPENRKEDGSSHHEPNTPNNQSIDTCPQPQTSGEQSIHIQEPDRELNPEREPQMHKQQNISSQPSMVVGSNDQQPLSLEFKDQQPGKGNHQTSMGISNEQVMSTVNQHASTGMGMSSQQRMSTQQPMTSSNQQAGATLKLHKQVPFGMLLPIIQPQLDKDRAMQLQTLYLNLKKNEISKDGFVKHMRNIVGDQMLKMAVFKLQTQARNAQAAAANQFQSQASARQMQIPSSDLSNSKIDGKAARLLEVESQADPHGMQISQERKHPAFPTQGSNKQQNMPFQQSSFPTYGSAGSSYAPFSAANASSSTSIRSQPHDSLMRQASGHHNMAVNNLGPTTQAMNMMNMSKFDRSQHLSDPKKMQAGSLTHMNSNTAMQPNQVQWPLSTNAEQKSGVSSAMTNVKQEPLDQSNDQHKAQLSSPHGLSSLSPGPFKSSTSASGNLKDEAFEMQSSRTGFIPSTSLLTTNSVSPSIPSPMETNLLSNSRMPSLTSPIGAGINSKTPAKKPLTGQKKPMEAPGSSPPSSKKQKVSGAFSDQSIEHLNDVTAVSGVNLREEEEQLFSGSKEESRASEASRLVVQEEEERLILEKIPLQKKVAEIMAKSGLKNMSNDVERYLSLCVEERIRALLCNAIRLSKQRVDIEKPRHRTIVTSDVRKQIMSINRKARAEWEKKQAETEKSQKPNDAENTNGVDGDKEKDESRAKSAKANKEEDDKMRATAANVAVRAATGVGDMLSRWQLMIEAKQKQGGSDTSSGSQPSKDVTRKPSATPTKNNKENQETEKRDTSSAFTTPASVRKVGRNQIVVPRVARSISIKDVIAVLEREPQTSKSALLYRLYNKVTDEAAADAAAE